MMCHIHSEPLHDLDLWPQYQNYIFTMNVFVSLFICGFWSQLRFFYLYGDVNITGEGLQLQIAT